MKSITIKGSQRESVGKSATKALRNAGQVPCVIYGGDKVLHFSAEEKAFKNLVYTPNVYTATIEVNGEKFETILQDIQFHPIHDQIIHADFYQLQADKEISMSVPVKVVGKSKGVAMGGALRNNLRKLKVKAIPANLPDSVEVNVTELQIGNKLYVSSLRNDSYQILHNDNTVVAQVRMSRNAAKAAAETEE
ncbi:large subunit ribosomal protein L25 [Wenyingzhuangia heitensis]|uniref:Large ribosomal subunit protein bL25 n=1 Tax=Wenyingzhuangia heitensis TaxID=1487859 RepID=A0ABX0U6W9_9FLAO|nr:50S ribosomal protein L25/general stress protein Ctc [Wenyingzhuangia heitensis]NIJ43715.1 large subunit ribosomal protein L25 [Wenyingzhuangia heitensis]